MTTICLQGRVLRVVIVRNLPFYFAENDEFKMLLKDAYPDCIPLTRHGLVDLLGHKAKEARAAFHKVLGNLGCKIHLALDCWTSRMNLGYLGTTPIFM